MALSLPLLRTKPVHRENGEGKHLRLEQRPIASLAKIATRSVIAGDLIVHNVWIKARTAPATRPL